MPAPKGHRIPNAPRGRKGPNKLTKSVKEAFEHAFRDAQADPKNPSNLKNFAKESPREFIAAAARLIPTELKGEMSHTVTPNVNLVIAGMTGQKLATVETDPVGVDGRKPD